MMKPYKEYKSINEFWLRNIPSSWDRMKIKYLFTERIEKGYPNKPLLVASQNMGVVPKNIYGSRTVEALKDLHLLKLVRKGDFVISLRSFQGSIEYAHYEGIISPAYTVMVPNNDINSHYYKYLFKTINFISLLKNNVTGIREGQNIDYQRLKNHLIPIPPRPEQDQIVRFLDWKVERINIFLTKICGRTNIDPKEFERYPKALLSLIIEYRARLISDVVSGRVDVRNADVPESSEGENNDTEQ